MGRNSRATTARGALFLFFAATLGVLSAPLSAIEVATGAMLGPRYKSERFYVRGSAGTKWQLTYTGGLYRRQARGKLMTLRLGQSLFDDEWLEERQFDPAGNTTRVIEALDFYKQHGVLALTVSLQSGNPGYDEKVNGIARNGSAKHGKNGGALISAFAPDGSLKPAWMARLERLLRAVDQRGMVVCLTYFHPAQDEIFEEPEAIAAAARNITDWLIEKNFRNVIINVADEWDLGGRSWDHARFIPENIDRLVELVRERFNHADYTLPIGASSSGKMSYPDSLARVCDLVLLHGDGRTPGEKLSRLRQFRSTGRALWMIRDDNGRETTPANLLREKASADALFKEGAGWGYMPWKQAHRFPFAYVPQQTSELTEEMPESRRDDAYFRAVLEHIAELVLRKPPRSVPKKKGKKR